MTVYSKNELPDPIRQSLSDIETAAFSRLKASPVNEQASLFNDSRLKSCQSHFYQQMGLVVRENLPTSVRFIKLKALLSEYSASLNQVVDQNIYHTSQHDASENQSLLGMLIDAGRTLVEIAFPSNYHKRLNRETRQKYYQELSQNPMLLVDQIDPTGGSENDRETT